MKTKLSTPRSFLSAASRSVSTVGLIVVLACGAAAQQWTGPDASNNISNANSGNVGIGTSSPTGKLDIVSTAAATQFTLKADADRVAQISFYHGGTDKWYLSSRGTNDAPNHRFAFFYNTGSGYAERLTIDSSGNVGIGTSTPGTGGYGQAKLDVVGRVRVRASDANLTAGIWLNDSHSASGSADQAFVGRSLSATSGFWNSTGWALNVHDNGNVGIGTTSPTKKLHVAGDIQVDGNINAKYQDMAEWVPSSEQLDAGTVVVLDTTKSNQVVASAHGYDTRVAGVISAQPGITLGESGEGKVLVATTGRVRVKVDASRGAIQIGDLLVTSDVAGVAMKSEPVDLAGRKMHMPGTIIGKALEPLAKGSGEILVLLSLQ